MPVSPAMTEELIAELVELYSNAESSLLRRYAEMLAQGLELPTWAANQIARINEAGEVAKDVTKQLSASTMTTMASVLERAWALGGTAASVDVGIKFGGVNNDAIKQLLMATQTTFQPIGARIRSSAPARYASVVNQVSGLMLSGALTRRQATAMAVTQWADAGVDGFIDSRGRRWNMATFAETATRTMTSQAVMNAHSEVLVSEDVDLVHISSSPEECPRCRPYEGQVLSITGKTPLGFHTVNGTRFRVVSTLKGAISDGLFHPNCTHRQTMYTPGLSRPMRDTANPEGYKLRQKQRAYERRIRELKRRVLMLEEVDPMSAMAERKKLRAKQSEFKTWRDTHGRKNLAYRTRI